MKLTSQNIAHLQYTVHRVQYCLGHHARGQCTRLLFTNDINYCLLDTQTRGEKLHPRVTPYRFSTVNSFAAASGRQINLPIINQLACNIMQCDWPKT